MIYSYSLLKPLGVEKWNYLLLIIKPKKIENKGNVRIYTSRNHLTIFFMNNLFNTYYILLKKY